MKLFVGEDLLAAHCADSAELSAKVVMFRESGDWEEVVRGTGDLTVKYDPLKMSGSEAEARFRLLWDLPVPKDAGVSAPVVLEA
ncbi:MAG TPA: hypothetical protein VGN36_03230, partial [Sphingorhabdus sp.]|nr:hypothetical protein [Sphingorhabdus sp.]